MKYRLSGFCFVPNRATMEVEASSEKEAHRIANQRFKESPRQYIVGQSGDDSAAFDWEPEIEEVL